MGMLPVTVYSGQIFDNNTAVILPKDENNLAAIWTYCSSTDFFDEVRRLDSKTGVTNATLVKVPFDLEHWQKVAEEKYPNGLPEPHSDDPTQWLFKGHPKGSEQPLQVAVARLLGYRWPDQEPDELDRLADRDGIVPLPSLRDEPTAAERLRLLLQTALKGETEATSVESLLSGVGFGGKTLQDWLSAKTGFFEQHIKLFHTRPFIWQIWDGQNGGFSALVNYHKLTDENLNRLIHTYLGEWIARQRRLTAADEPGAALRLKAAEELREKLLLIQTGAPPYDIYVRWKPLDQQPVGWEPDLNDGVRMNIRPFVEAGILRTKVNVNWKHDRGANPPGSDVQRWAEAAQRAAVNSAQLRSRDGSERLNDLHLALDVKRAARSR
jgi:hypothetical protein